MRTANAAFLSLVLAATLTACGEKSQAPAAPAAPSRDYKAEAARSIDEKNMQSELDRLKQEVESDSK